jgi:AcrR family transcriptional regulator
VVRNPNRRSNNRKPPGSAGERRARRQLATRLAILRAAAGVFRERGFDHTGMRDIARAADLSPGNLYYYFSSKAELLYFCQDHSVGRMTEALRRLRREAPSPADRLGRLVTEHLTCMLDELDGAAAHTEVDSLPEPLRRRIVLRRDRYERGVRRLVADGVRSGAFVRCDPALVTRALLGALNWTARWYRPGGALSPAAVAREYSSYLIRGLLK